MGKKPLRDRKNGIEKEDGKMHQNSLGEKPRPQEGKKILVALDFSECSKAAYHKVYDIFQDRIAQIIMLHVIDAEFVKRCVKHGLGEKRHIKKGLFLEAKRRLQEFLDSERHNGIQTEAVVSEGVPYLEINRKAHEFRADLIVIGSCGRAVDTDRIFFGATAEKVLRFINHPVLCIPPDGPSKTG